MKQRKRRVIIEVWLNICQFTPQYQASKKPFSIKFNRKTAFFMPNTEGVSLIFQNINYGAVPPKDVKMPTRAPVAEKIAWARAFCPGVY